MKTKKQAGFTLIEIMIAFSILTLLGTIIQGQFLGARDKARDGTVRHALSALRSVAFNQYFDYSPNTYSPICGDSPVDLMLDDLAAKNGVTSANYQCTASPDEWVAIFPLKSISNAYWCSDSNGASKQVVGFLASTGNGNLNCENATLVGGGQVTNPPPPPPPPPSPNTPPVITLIGETVSYDLWSQSANPFSGNGIGANKYNEPGYTAIDTEDGNINQLVIATGPTLVSTAGPNSCKRYTYNFAYNVTDSGGLSATTQNRTVVHHKCKSQSDPLYTPGADDNDPND